MKQDLNHVFNPEKGNKITFEELHIRHLNLIKNIKTKSLNNWFLKMAITNTFDDLKVFLYNLKKGKNKVIIAINQKKIVDYINIYPLNEKETCLKISKPELINNEFSISDKDIIKGLIKKAISITDIKTSSWILNSDINNFDLISCARELGFQPLKEIKLWSLKTPIDKTNPTKIVSADHEEFHKINKLNLSKVLHFIRSNQSQLIRTILDFDQQDILNRNDFSSGVFIYNQSILCTILKDINYLNESIYTLTTGKCWDNRLNPSLRIFLNYFFKNNPSSTIKTYAENIELNSYLEKCNLFVKSQEIILVRNTIIKNEAKQHNKINQSLESIFDKLNPQGNPYPSPFPLKSK